MAAEKNVIEIDASDTVLLTSACPGCGTEMIFDPDAKKLICPNCKNQSEISLPEEATENKSDFMAELERLSDEAEYAEELTIRCPNCGAEVKMARNITADRCIYCATPLVAASLSRRQIKPSALLPFGISLENAKKSYETWLKSCWFLPSPVKREYKTQQLRGCYLPFWLYDCQVKTAYHGMRGVDYYVTVRYTTRDSNGKTVNRTRQERRTHWYSASGKVKNEFQNLLIPASQGATQEMLDELEPWDLHQLTPCHDDHLKGYQSEVYHTTLKDGFVNAEHKMTPKIETTICADIGGDQQRITSMSRSYSDIMFKHILLPVYLSTMSYRGKSYRFVINARTGEVQGTRPYSFWKILFLILTILAILFLLVLCAA